MKHEEYDYLICILYQVARYTMMMLMMSSDLMIGEEKKVFWGKNTVNMLILGLELDIHLIQIQFISESCVFWSKTP